MQPQPQSQRSSVTQSLPSSNNSTSSSAPQQPMQPQAGAGMPQPNNGQASQQPSGRQGQNYNPNLLPQIEQHLNSLPPEQKGFLAKFMTPELAVVLGIVIGNEAFDYFKQFADPKKQLVVQERKQQEKSASQPAQKSGHMMQPSGGQAPQAQQAQPQAAAVQPKANTAPSIMGV